MQGNTYQKALVYINIVSFCSGFVIFFAQVFFELKGISNFFVALGEVLFQKQWTKHIFINSWLSYIKQKSFNVSFNTKSDGHRHAK